MLVVAQPPTWPGDTSSNCNMAHLPPASILASPVRLPPIRPLSSSSSSSSAASSPPPPPLPLLATPLVHPSRFHQHPLRHHPYHHHHHQDQHHQLHQQHHHQPRRSFPPSVPPSMISNGITDTPSATAAAALASTSASSSLSPTAAAALAIAARHEDDLSFSLSDEDMLLCDDGEDDDVWSDAGLSSIEGGAGGRSNAERRNNNGSAASSIVGGGGGKRNANGRSRRLLSLEQSKVLYKILDKTHFPSTQLREAAAAQLGVSPRKVQVWFQNRRQVGKKRMMEAVQSYLSTYPCSPSTPVSVEMLQDQLRSMGKLRFSHTEDERTRAWRKHTIRLALSPSAQEEEESKAAIRELERGGSAREYHYQQHQHQHQHQQQQQQQTLQQRYLSPQRHQHQHQYRQRSATDSYGSVGVSFGQREREREMIRGGTSTVEPVSVSPSCHAYEWDSLRDDSSSHMHDLGRIRASRSSAAAALRINVVPHIGSHSIAASSSSKSLAAESHTPATASASASVATPTYTGPGSATHLEMLSARNSSSHGDGGGAVGVAVTTPSLMPPFTPAAVRASIVPPAIVSSQKESFSLYPQHHYAHPQHLQHTSPLAQQRFHRQYLAHVSPSSAAALAHHPQRQQQQQQQQLEHRMRSSSNSMPFNGSEMLPSSARRDRSATLAGTPSSSSSTAAVQRWDDAVSLGGIKQVRNTLTAEWHAQQRLLYHSQPPPHGVTFAASAHDASTMTPAMRIRSGSSTDAAASLRRFSPSPSAMANLASSRRGGERYTPYPPPSSWRAAEGMVLQQQQHLPSSSSSAAAAAGAASSNGVRLLQDEIGAAGGRRGRSISTPAVRHPASPPGRNASRKMAAVALMSRSPSSSPRSPPSPIGRWTTAAAGGGGGRNDSVGKRDGDTELANRSACSVLTGTGPASRTASRTDAFATMRTAYSASPPTLGLTHPSHSARSRSPSPPNTHSPRRHHLPPPLRRRSTTTGVLSLEPSSLTTTAAAADHDGNAKENNPTRVAAECFVGGVVDKHRPNNSGGGGGDGGEGEKRCTRMDVSSFLTSSKAANSANSVNTVTHP